MGKACSRSLSRRERRKRESCKNASQAAVTGKDIILFTDELSALLAAGLPLEPALASMEGEMMRMFETTGIVPSRQQVTDGVPLHVALPKVSSKFDALYCNLVAAGEASGSLAGIVTQHAKYLKNVPSCVLNCCFRCSILRSCWWPVSA